MRYLITLITFAFFIFPSVARGDVYTNIADSIMPYLNVKTGRVIKVHKNYIILNKGSKEGMVKNDFVYIYRNEGNFIPLNSKRPIPLKVGICYANVTKVNRSVAKAKIVSGIVNISTSLLGLGIIPYGQKELIGKPKVGDRWIAGKTQYRVAIITRNPIVYDSLKEALRKTERFFVINPNVITIVMTEKRINNIDTSKSIKELSNALNADLILYVSVMPDFSKISYRLVNGYSAMTITKGSYAMGKEEKVVLEENIGLERSISPNNIVASNLSLQPKLTLWESLLGRMGLYSPYSRLQISNKSYNLVSYVNLGYKATAMRTIYINHIPYIFVALGNKVDVYIFALDTFNKVAEFSYGNNIFYIDDAYINGKTLITLSNYNMYGNLDSAIGYFKDRKFHIIKDNIHYNIRFYNKFSLHPLLIAQAASINKPFYGPIYKLDLKNFRISRFQLPIHFESFYEFQRIRNNIVYISISDQLQVYNIPTRKVTYKSEEIFVNHSVPVKRYSHVITAREIYNNTVNALNTNDVYINKGLSFYKGKKWIYVLSKRGYLSNAFTIRASHYNAYSVFMYKIDKDKLTRIYSSGNLSGNMVAFNRVNDYIIGILAVPTNFMTNLLLGEPTLFRLSAFAIK